MADWQMIKTEYITTQTSYRKLAKKYGVHYNAIANRAKQEGWVAQRDQFCDETVTKTVTAISEQQADRAAKLMGVSDLLLDMVRQAIENGGNMNTQGMKNLSGVLKDIKEIQMIRSDGDLMEQEARIANLQRQAQRDDSKSGTVTVLLDGEMDDYAN
jgi:transposase-like protein